MLTPEEAREWQKIIRDVIIVLVGTFILVHETLGAGEPNLYLIGAGLAALGLPPALRLDERRRNGGGDAR